MGLVRLFLAVVVMTGHLSSIYLPLERITVGKWVNLPVLGLNAGVAVIYFYVISGFLISYSLAHNHRQDAAGLIGYARSRFIRIFSLYWPLLAIAFIVQPPASDSVVARLTGTFLIGSDWYACFASYPAQDFSNFPVRINQAWTLGAELTFYALAPVLTRSLHLAIILLALSAACRLFLVRRYGFDETWTYHFFPSTAMFFIIGHLARLIGEKYPALRSHGWRLLGISLALSVLGLHHWRWDSPQFYASMFLFALALPGVFEATKHSRWSARLGDLSYPMYLTHKLTLTAIYELLPWIGASLTGVDALFVPGAISLVVATAACLAVAIAAHWLIEKPTAMLMRWALAGAAVSTHPALPPPSGRRP